MTSHTYDPIAHCAKAAERITSRGFTINLVVYAEDARTPGLLGQIRGVTDWERREVKIALAAVESMNDLAEVLEHEARHVEEPEWDCGNRDVLGRGAPALFHCVYCDLPIYSEALHAPKCLQRPRATSPDRGTP